MFMSIAPRQYQCLDAYTLPFFRPIGGSSENMARRSVAYDECDLVPIDELVTPCFTVEGEWIHATAQRDIPGTGPGGIVSWTSQNQNYLP